jgi:hypothetical protein
MFDATAPALLIPKTANVLRVAVMKGLPPNVGLAF